MKRRFNPKKSYNNAVSSVQATKSSRASGNGNVNKAIRLLIQARQILSIDDPHINRIVFDIEDLENECKDYLEAQRELADC